MKFKLPLELLNENGRYIIRDQKGRKLGDYGDKREAESRRRLMAMLIRSVELA